MIQTQDRDSWRKVAAHLLQPPQGSLSNPTLWVFWAVVAAFTLSCWLAVTGFIPLWGATLCNSLCLYAIYIVMHDAVHDLAHANAFWNGALGRFCAAMEGITFPMVRILHMQHHYFTNDPHKDPDYVIGRKPRWLLPLWVIVRLLHDNSFMLKNRLWAKKPIELVEHLLTLGLQLSISGLMVWHGYTMELLFLWVVPMVVAGLSVELVVAWLVHFPHESTHTLEHTRLFQGGLAQVLMLNQNYHLIHHVWPKIPWFRYGKQLSAIQTGLRLHHSKKDSSGN